MKAHFMKKLSQVQTPGNNSTQTRQNLYQSFRKVVQRIVCELYSQYETEVKRYVVRICNLG